MKLKHYLIASEENDYQPAILQSGFLVIFCLIIWGIRIFTPTQFTQAAPSIDPQILMEKINLERTQRFLPALITNEKLLQAASIKSSDMLARSYFDHINPDGDYVWPTIEAAGYTPYQTLGENLAMDFSTADSVVSAWMNSPSHRANIVNEKFQDQGLASIYGLFESGHNTIMITNLFGTLLNATLPQQSTTPKTSGSTAPPPSPPPPSSSPEPTPKAEAPLTNIAPEPKLPATAETDSTAIAPQPRIPTTLKIIFGILALTYVIFLLIDSIIVYQAKLNRSNVHPSPHALIFFLIAMVNLFAFWL